jgi:hypothetical protein
MNSIVTRIKGSYISRFITKIQSIPVQKVHVGDIDIAYKTFGKGEPFLLISGLGGTMDSWLPSTLKNLYHIENLYHKSHSNCI